MKLNRLQTSLILYDEKVECLGCSRVLDDKEPVFALSQKGKEYMVRSCCCKCMCDTDNHEKFVKDGWSINEIKPIRNTRSI